MRKSTQKVFSSWMKNGRMRPGAAIWTEDGTIYSYSTPIVKREGGRVFFNVERYSQTTSNHQNGLRALLSGEGISWETWDHSNS